MPALRWWHGRLHFPCGEMSSLATPVTADYIPKVIAPTGKVGQIIPNYIKYNVLLSVF
jgi:hypothetical protein